MSQSTRAAFAKAVSADAASPQAVDWATLMGGETSAAQPVSLVTVNASTPAGAAAFTAGALTYSENFDSLVSSGTGTGAAFAGGTLLGTTDFVFFEGGTGTTGLTTYTAGTGSSNTGDTYSFGAAGSTDRAIGSVASGSKIPSYGILFTNNTGSTITSLAISYTGEQWRSGGRTVANGSDRLDFQYSTTATTINATGFVDYDPLDFTSPSVLPSTASAAGLDGNLAANRTLISSTLAVNLAAGATIFLRWADSDMIGSDDGLAIDDFSITATTTAAPTGPSIAISDVSVAEGNAGTSLLTFTVTRSDATTAFSVDYATANGTATAGSDYVASNGTLTFAADGALTQTISVVVNGDVLFEPNETVLVNLSNVVNASGSTTISDAQGVGTITNDDSQPTISIDDVTHAEGDGGTTAYTFTVSLSGASSQTVSVGYTTADGTATTADGDYAAASGTVTFAPGVTSQTVTVLVNGDAKFEPDQGFVVNLSGATNATIADAQGTGTITNDDANPGAISIADVAQAEGDSGTTVFTFTVTRDSTANATTVDYAVAFNGSADAADFVGALPSGTVAFAAGETSKTITVNVQGDTLFENAETFLVNLSNATNGATIAVDHATGTIQNDDPVPANGSLSIADVTQAEGNAGATDFVFTVTRTGGTDGTVSATYTVAHGTTDAADFATALPTGTVTFADGQTTATVTVSVAGDAVYEADETFTVTLADPQGGAVLGVGSATGTITNDDPLPSLSINDPVVTEGNDGTVLLTYTVTASGVAPAGGIHFDIATADGTATAGSDYVAHSVTGATIAAGETSYSFTVTVNGDTMAERNETVLVNVTNATNATIADAQGVGTIRNDDGVPATALIFSETFDGFTAAGFAPTPGAGQLDSDVWRVAGLSDVANPAYGFTGPAGGDFGRGTIVGTANPTTAGVFSPAGAGALILQATGAEVDAGGYIEAKIQNTSGFTASSFDVAFDWMYRNNEARGEVMQLSYSTDGVTFTVAPAGAFTTPTTAVAGATFVAQHEDVQISNLDVGDQGYLYLRWTHVSSVGSGSRDEVGIDNVSVTGGLTATTVGTVADISVAEGNSGTTAATFTITRSGDTGVATVDYATANGTAVAGVDYVEQHGTVTFADGETSKTVTVLINGDTANEANETFFLNLSNPTGLVLPDAQAIATITNDDSGPVGIYDIQGRGITSGFTGQTVTTHGVVTAVDTNGFFLQDAVGDGDIATSDGIFVFTSTAPTVVVGNEISVTGIVQEFVGTTAGSASVTELTSPTNIVVTHDQVALPAAVLISTDGTGRAPPTEVIDNDGLTSYDPTTDGFDFYESLEGMLVTIQTPRVVANTDSFGETYVVASNGVGATGLNDRSGMTISAGDNNPETIVITRDAGVNASYTANHTQGDVLGNVTGVLNYQFAQYQLIVTDPVVTTTSAATQVRETTSLVGDATHLSYASFNLENLASVPDSTVDNRNTQAKVDLAFATHASEIVNALKSPDIIGLQEVQDADGIGNGTDLTGAATAAKLIAAIVAAGGPTYVYVEIAPTVNNASGGEPGGNIRQGFLYNPERVDYVDGSAHLLDDPAYSGTRKPLIADFTFNGQTFTAADLHSTSRGGSDPLLGADQPPTQAGDAARTAQATALATYIAGVLQSDPTHKFVVNGDFNGYYYEDALKALEATDGGTGALSNLYDKLPVAERYSYYFGGYYQAFDNILVSGSLYADTQFDVVHYNAGFTDGLSETDHDQVVATIGLTRADGVAVAVADAFAGTIAAQIKGSVLANDTGGGTALAVTAVNGSAVGGTVRLASGASVVMHADGTFAYDADGAFGALAAGQSATDSFSYTLSGGSTATVSVTVNGVTATAPSAGNDIVIGTTGSDLYDLSAGGDDTVSGGAGDDGFAFGAAFTAADHVDGGSGTNDQIGLHGDYTGAHALVLGANTISGIELIAAQAGFSYDLTTVDANVATGATLAIYGTTLGAGDTLTFNGAAETDGRFMVYGGLGADTITTGAGDDGIYFGRDGRFNPATDHVDGGAGTNDQLALDGSYTVTIAHANVVNVETLVLLDDSATPATYDVTIADDWTAANEAHTIYAVTVRTGVTINASAESDSALRIFGGQGGDTIVGGSAGNWISGGGGSDTITGGAGVDTFSYAHIADSIGTAHDILINFDASLDKIDLPFAVIGIDAAATGSASAGTLDQDLTAALSTLGANHAVQFTVTAGDLAAHVFEVIDANGVAGYQAGQDMVIELQGSVTPIVDPTPFV